MLTCLGFSAKLPSCPEVGSWCLGRDRPPEGRANLGDEALPPSPAGSAGCRQSSRGVAQGTGVVFLSAAHFSNLATSVSGPQGRCLPPAKQQSLCWCGGGRGLTGGQTPQSVTASPTPHGAGHLCPPPHPQVCLHFAPVQSCAWCPLFPAVGMAGGLEGQREHPEAGGYHLSQPIHPFSRVRGCGAKIPGGTLWAGAGRVPPEALCCVLAIPGKSGDLLRTQNQQVTSLLRPLTSHSGPTQDQRAAEGRVPTFCLTTPWASCHPLEESPPPRSPL